MSVKNTFSMDDETAFKETGGMMQILCNVVYSPHVDGKPLTYGEMVSDAQFKTSVTAADRANSDYGAFQEAAESMRTIPPKTPVVMLAEVQLHLRHYMDERKKTHLWFKVLRAATMTNLHYDC